MKSAQQIIKEIKAQTPDPIRGLVMYKKHDPGLALFRVQAVNNISEIIIRVSENKQLLAKHKEYLKQWILAPPGGVGDIFRDFLNALETSVGHKIPLE